MTERLTETQIHEWLDTNGHLDQSHDPGVYAIRLHVPDDPEKRWYAEKDVSPPESGFFDAIVQSGLIYVGASETSVYMRLLDHGRGSVRQPSIIQVYPPVEMYDVAFDEREFNYALRVHNESGCVVWCDGECYY